MHVSILCRGKIRMIKKTFQVIKTRKVDEETKNQALNRIQTVLLLQRLSKIIIFTLSVFNLN